MKILNQEDLVDREATEQDDKDVESEDIKRSVGVYGRNTNDDYGDLRLQLAKLYVSYTIEHSVNGFCKHIGFIIYWRY